VREAEETLEGLRRAQARAEAVTPEELASGRVAMLEEEPPWLFSKTRGVPEAQLTGTGMHQPVVLEPAELARTREWEQTRNAYLKKWREFDTSPYPAETARLLGGRGADNAIRKHMTPDDLAAVLKERRGVQILDPDGQPYNHLMEADDAMASVRNRIIELEKRIETVQRAPTPHTITDEVDVLQEKLGDLSRLLDQYKQ